MTRQEIESKTQEMVKGIEGMIESEVGRLLSSGAVDVGAYEDNIGLPKILLYAAIKNVAEGWAPFFWDKAAKKEIKNLTAF